MVTQWSVLLSLFACNRIFGAGETVPVTPTAPSTTTPVETTSLPSEPQLAGGLEISKVSLYQGVESVLVENGDRPTTLEMPVITGRDGLLRVFVDPDNNFETRKVVAVLTVVDNDGETEFTERFKVQNKSKDNDLESTFNFDLPGDLIKQTTEFEVELLETDVTGPGGGTKKKATWKSEKNGGLDTEATDTLHVKIIPIRYDADGSGRLPDTSASQLKLVEELVRGVYPAQDVEVTAEPPYPWPNTISAFSTSQWSNILDEMSYYRDSRNEPPNTYYYGAFEPATSVNQFCAQGCILGLSYLAYNTAEFFRASVGVGYTGSITSETLVHEMGHAHGREHAPCGLYGQPADNSYPYTGGKIGSWGYDIVGKRLLDPDTTVDMMSYCSPIWISDYTFYSTFLRMKTVAAQARSAPMPRTTLRLNEDGTTAMGPAIAMSDLGAGPRVDVTLFDANGLPAGTSTAAFFPYDHVPGGMIALDQELPEGWTATVAD